MNRLDNTSRIHIVGVGGAGMSALALLLHEMGAAVSGSDAIDSSTMRELRRAGIRVVVGHDAKNLGDATIVTWSPAVGHDNVELTEAARTGRTMLSRGQILAQLAELRRVVGLTGTHGKTTATSMMVHVMRAAGYDCARLLGAPVRGVGANGHWGSDDLVVEVDESYGTFALLAPYALGLLNVEADHLDHYGSLEALDVAFRDLVNRTTGPVVAWADDRGARRVVEGSARNVVLVGTNDEVQWRVCDIEVDRHHSSFWLRGPSEELRVTLGVTGRHNVANAAVVGVLALSVGIPPQEVIEGLENFLGAPRRFEFRGSWRGVDVYEDYAHLPGEIRATLEATRAAGYERIAVVFQPHRVTRTVNLVQDFAGAFDGASRVVVTDIYAAGEANPTGVTGELIVHGIRGAGPDVETVYCASLNDVPARLEPWHDTSDVLLLLGAGDVATVADRLRGGLSR